MPNIHIIDDSFKNLISLNKNYYQEIGGDRQIKVSNNDLLVDKITTDSNVYMKRTANYMQYKF